MGFLFLGKIILTVFVHWIRFIVLFTFFYPLIRLINFFISQEFLEISLPFWKFDLFQVINILHVIIKLNELKWHEIRVQDCLGFNVIFIFFLSVNSPYQTKSFYLTFPHSSPLSPLQNNSSLYHTPLLLFHAYFSSSSVFSMGPSICE